MRKLLLHPATKPLVFVLCLLPLVWLVVVGLWIQSPWNIWN